MQDNITQFRLEWTEQGKEQCRYAYSEIPIRNTTAIFSRLKHEGWLFEDCAASQSVARLTCLDATGNEQGTYGLTPEGLNFVRLWVKTTD